MIAHLRGTLLEKHPNLVIVDTGGVGYEVTIPVSAYSSLPEAGTEVRLHIHTHVREDALQLFGFQDAAEKQIFLLLTAVSGIGPRLALNILSVIASDDLARALKESDQVRLVAIPGVGRKLAERMIVELKDKLMAFGSESASSKPSYGDSQLMQDAVSALVNLGYRKAEAENNVRTVLKRGQVSLEEVLKEALRRMSL